MAHTAAAKKSLRQNRKSRTRNLVVLQSMRKSIHDARKGLTAGAADNAKAAVAAAIKSLDRAAAKGVVKKNLAARKKSRLVQALNKLGK